MGAEPDKSVSLRPKRKSALLMGVRDSEIILAPSEPLPEPQVLVTPPPKPDETAGMTVISTGPNSAPIIIDPNAPPPRRKLVRGGNAPKETYVEGYKEAMTAIDDLDNFLSAEAERYDSKHAIGVLSTAPEASSPEPAQPQSARDDVGDGTIRRKLPVAPSRAASSVRQAPPPPPPVTPTAAAPAATSLATPVALGVTPSAKAQGSTSSLLSPASATTASPATSADPPRRKLVRGGNAPKETYVEGYQEAMAAIDTLDLFLDREHTPVPSPSTTPTPDHAEQDRRLSSVPPALPVPSDKEVDAMAKCVRTSQLTYLSYGSQVLADW